MTEVIKEAALTRVLKKLQAVLLGGLLYICTTEGDPVRNIDSSVQESRATILNWVTFCGLYYSRPKLQAGYKFKIILSIDLFPIFLL